MRYVGTWRVAGVGLQQPYLSLTPGGGVNRRYQVHTTTLCTLARFANSLRSICVLKRCPDPPPPSTTPTPRTHTHTRHTGTRFQGQPPAHTRFRSHAINRKQAGYWPAIGSPINLEQSYVNDFVGNSLQVRSQTPRWCRNEQRGNLWPGCLVIQWTSPAV